MLPPVTPPFEPGQFYVAEQQERWLRENPGHPGPNPFNWPWNWERLGADERARYEAMAEDARSEWLRNQQTEGAATHLEDLAQ